MSDRMLCPSCLDRLNCAICGEPVDDSGQQSALRWLAGFTSDEGDARMMDPGQARALIHRRALLALGFKEDADGRI